MFQCHRYAEKVVGNRIVYHLLVKPQKQLVTSLLLVLAILAVHFHANSEQIFCNPSIVQGGFFNWSALKMTKCQITCKSLQKSSKCQNFLRVWHLVIFRADQLKKPPCIYICIVRIYIVHAFHVKLKRDFCRSEPDDLGDKLQAGDQ